MIWIRWATVLRKACPWVPTRGIMTRTQEQARWGSDARGSEWETLEASAGSDTLKKARNCRACDRAFRGTILHAMHWQPCATPACEAGLYQGATHAEQDTCNRSGRGRDYRAGGGASAERDHHGRGARRPRDHQ